ncbi:hypothetical protein GQ600_20645 [Phytophthora cactorum]|nr:hypothetical protein GQ600_20645 [Phytophthora cactorum]
MRLQFSVLLVIVAFIASTQAAISNEHPKALKLHSAADRSFTVNKNRVQRFLRKQHSVDATNEERGILTALEKAKTLVSPKITDKTLQRWAANNKSPKHALTRLELDKAGRDQAFRKS